MHTLSRRKGIVGFSWAWNPCTHTGDFACGPYAIAYRPHGKAQLCLCCRPGKDVTRCVQGPVPAQPLQWLGSCLWKSPLCYPNDVFGTELVSSPLLTTGGSLVDHQLWGWVVSPKSSAIPGAGPQPVW